MIEKEPWIKLKKNDEKNDEEKKKNSFPQWSKSEANYPKQNKYIETVTNMREWKLNQYRDKKPKSSKQSILSINFFL